MRAYASINRLRHRFLAYGRVGAWAPTIQGPGGTVLRDYSGSGIDGGLKYMDPATDWVDQALDFDGANDYVDCGTDSKFTFGAGKSWSYSFWMKQRTAQTGWRGFMYHSSAGRSQGHIGLQATTRYLSAGTGDGSTWRTNSTTFVPSVGVWTPVAVTMDRGNDIMRIYAEGKEVGNFSHAYVPASPAHSLRIGEGNPGSEYFDGYIDSIDVYSRALSPQEIRLLATRRGIAYELDTYITQWGSVAEAAAAFQSAWGANATTVAGIASGF